MMQYLPKNEWTSRFDTGGKIFVSNLIPNWSTPEYFTSFSQNPKKYVLLWIINTMVHRLDACPYFFSSLFNLSLTHCMLANMMGGTSILQNESSQGKDMETRHPSMLQLFPWELSLLYYRCLFYTAVSFGKLAFLIAIKQLSLSLQVFNSNLTTYFSPQQ